MNTKLLPNQNVIARRTFTDGTVDSEYYASVEHFKKSKASKAKGLKFVSILDAVTQVVVAVLGLIKAKTAV